MRLDSYKFWAKPLFLLVAYCLHERPFVGIEDYLYALLVAYFLVFGVLRGRVKPILIGAALGLLVLGRCVPQLAIPEQQRMLLTVQNDRITPGQFLKDETKFPYFITADGYMQGFLDKRLVKTIDLDRGLLSLRTGWINRPNYNFYAPISSYKRDDLPFVVRYEIVPPLLGMTLDVEGLVLFEHNGRFKVHDPSVKTITLDEKLIGSHLYGFGGQWDDKGFNNLKISLRKSFKYEVYDALRIILSFLGLGLLFWGLFSIPLTLNVGIQTTFVCISLFIFWVDWGEVMRWGTLAGGGMDGVIHGGLPYQMLDQWVQGAWKTALMSPESVFYYMPGMRYVRFAEMLLFGDAYILQVCLLIFVPLIFYRFFCIFLSRNIAITLTLITFAYLLDGLGMSIRLYVQTFVASYGEGFSYALLFIALTLLAKPIQKVSWGLLAYFLLAISISIRPNLSILVAVLGIIHILSTTFSPLPRHLRFFMLFGLAPVLLIPLHNIIGGEFVLLTKSSQIPENLPLTPKMYCQALGYFLGYNETLSCTDRFSAHFQDIYPQHICAWLACLWLAFKGHTSIVRGFAIATFAGLSTHLFYLPVLRYLHPYMMISIVLLLSQIPRLRVKAIPQN